MPLTISGNVDGTNDRVKLDLKYGGNGRMWIENIPGSFSLRVSSRLKLTIDAQTLTVRGTETTTIRIEDEEEVFYFDFIGDPLPFGGEAGGDWKVVLKNIRTRSDRKVKGTGKVYLRDTRRSIPVSLSGKYFQGKDRSKLNLRGRKKGEGGSNQRACEVKFRDLKLKSRSIEAGRLIYKLMGQKGEVNL